ncbi:uncharacterized protein N7483_007925 [Penicillium malachiteum]|uniref:uncharacterized protein n=1 Tax=Penicillium malachiteum TaxID=1324776 RepID=UPI0025467D45|nr:uncharacterized protein N7483_007925 [Penicillium malachiteum]KAJ5726568.1 hypothetical protein N7483_007925 [Penicillium malachiteum]
MLKQLRAKLKLKVRGQKHDEEAVVSSTDDENAVGTKVDIDATSTRGADIDTPQRENLWVVAGERLDEKYRNTLDLESAGPVMNSIDDLIKTTEEKYREYKEGGLKIRKRGGGHINVQDSAKNIILYALQAQDLVKKLVSFDPTGHASTAWSVGSISITLIKNDIKRRDNIFEASEYLARILSYYAIIDNKYRERGVESDQGLDDALLEVYAAVLEYTAEVKKAVDESDAVGCGKSVLCSTIIQDIKTLCASDPSRRFAYWYFQFNNDATQKVYNMTRSILRQLMPRTFPGSLVNLWEDHSHRGSKRQLQKFADILDIVLEDSQGKSFLILDAMDECPATEHEGRSSLLEFMEDLSRKHPSKLHILATSRPEPDIRLMLKQYESVDLRLD